MEKDKYYTSSGEIKAGAPVPDSIPTQSDAHKKLNSLQAKIDKVEQKVSKEIVLANLLGYNIQKMEELQKQCIEELHSDSRDNMSLAAWVRYIREATKRIEIKEGSLARQIENEMMNYAKTNGHTEVDVRILPTFFYHEQFFLRDIDIIIDIDFMPNSEYEEPTFRSLKIVPDDSAEDLCITHQDRIEAGVDHTLRVVPTNDTRYKEMIESVAREVFESAKKLYDTIRGGRKNNGEKKSTTTQGKRVVSFKDINRREYGWHAADKI